MQVLACITVPTVALSVELADNLVFIAFKELFDHGVFIICEIPDHSGSHLTPTNRLDNIPLIVILI
jgi:hypothetical protein